MNNVLRTTITVPESLWQETKYWALAKNKTVSALIRECLEEKMGKKIGGDKLSILDVAGSLNLGGKNPPSRSELYAKHIRNKIRA